MNKKLPVVILLAVVLCAGTVHADSITLDQTQYDGIIKTVNDIGSMTIGSILALIFAVTWKG